MSSKDRGGLAGSLNHAETTARVNGVGEVGFGVRGKDYVLLKSN